MEKVIERYDNSCLEDHKYNLLLSEYSLATSATASPILFLTVLVCSAPNASSSFCLMAYACSCGMDRKSSKLSPEATLRVFEAIRRKITAAKERVCNRTVSDHILTPSPLSMNVGVGEIMFGSTHSCVVGAIYLLHQSHKQHLGLRARPIRCQMIFCL
jgi:hypothetical protein